MPQCPATMVSAATPDHVHVCGADAGPRHGPDDDHFCPECGRWFWQRNPKPVKSVSDPRGRV